MVKTSKSSKSTKLVCWEHEWVDGSCSACVKPHEQYRILRVDDGTPYDLFGGSGVLTETEVFKCMASFSQFAILEELAPEEYVAHCRKCGSTKEHLAWRNRFPPGNVDPDVCYVASVGMCVGCGKPDVPLAKIAGRVGCLECLYFEAFGVRAKSPKDFVTAMYHPDDIVPIEDHVLKVVAEN